MIRFGTNLLVSAGLWTLITEGRADSWIVGGPVVLAAAMASVLLAHPQRCRWSAIGLLRFVPHFVRTSLHGGIDVAWRSLHPRLPIHPELVEYHCRLPDGTARTFFMGVVNLLPGTVSADFRVDLLLVHVIDDRQPIQDQLEKLEQAVGALFATPIETNRKGECPS